MRCEQNVVIAIGDYDFFLRLQRTSPFTSLILKGGRFLPSNFRNIFSSICEIVSSIIFLSRRPRPISVSSLCGPSWAYSTHFFSFFASIMEQRKIIRLRFSPAWAELGMFRTIFLSFDSIVAWRYMVPLPFRVPHGSLCLGVE